MILPAVNRDTSDTMEWGRRPPEGAGRTAPWIPSGRRIIDFAPSLQVYS